MSPLLGPLRVVDLSSGVLGYCGRILADLGADVVLVEPPGGLQGRRGCDGRVASDFAFTSAGKRSIVLDVTSEAGQDALLRLTDRADVVIASAMPGELECAGLGHALLLSRNPRLVFASMTPYGLHGTRRSWRGSDLTAWAVSGALPAFGDPDRAPLTPRESLGLMAAALNAAMGTVVALESREQTGRGQVVDISLQEAVLSIVQELSPILALDTGQPPRRAGRRRKTPPMGQYAARDGAVMIVAYTPWQWRALAGWISEETGVPEVLSERYEGTPASRAPYRAELDGWIEELTTRYGKQEFAEEAQRRGIPVCPVNSVADLLTDPHLAATDSWRRVPSDGIDVLMPSPALILDGNQLPVGRIPAAGADSGDVLAELGLDESDVRYLLDCGEA